MPQSKPILVFLLKTLLIFGLLAAPFKFYDVFYGKIYRATCKLFLGKFHVTGVAFFTATKDPANTHVEIGNTIQADSRGNAVTAGADFNSRYRGYIPTVLFLALVFASPVSWKRRMVAALIGFMLMSAMIVLKQWIHIVYICEQKRFLALYDFTEGKTKAVHFLYDNFANYNGPSMVFAIAIWFLVSFRKNDIEVLKN